MNITDISFALEILSHPQSGDESDIKEALKTAIESLKVCKEILKEDSKTDVFDKMRTEIEQLPTTECTETQMIFIIADDFKEDVLEIIDKYKSESEDK